MGHVGRGSLGVRSDRQHAEQTAGARIVVGDSFARLVSLSRTWLMTTWEADASGHGGVKTPQLLARSTAEACTIIGEGYHCKKQQDGVFVCTWRMRGRREHCMKENRTDQATIWMTMDWPRGVINRPRQRGWLTSCLPLPARCQS